ncbi:MAG: ABC transporter permease [Bacteroidetes bacterium]|jgi:ABC-2 type transport system permease protein|uniref:ABC transporter permease n=1 Tax=Candidatus Cryptobacteroides avicola TaxID=2840757 RepID=A0A940IHH8_9BACT|nr:ABC transporter permease [Candidatus Cryptobacteroides avicola]
MKYIRQWFSDWYDIFTRELKHIFSDSGVMVIFFLAGLAYPLLYGLIYRNGSVDDMPVAVVDNSGSAASREFVRALDATREVSVAYACADMDQAQRLLQQRDAKGIVMIPSDYEDCLASGRQAHISTYADMSSFLYYKNLTMAASQVMLSEMHDIQTSRFSAAGYSGQQISQLVQPLKYEENMPYNRNFSYSIFFLSAVLLIVVQQTMFYGVSMLTGTMREENRSFAVLPDRLKGHGISRTVMGRGAAYWLLYIAIGAYVAALVPRIFGLPQNCPFGEIFILLLFYVTACVVFSFTFSSLIRHRETVFVLFLFMSPICLFLTGFSWPVSSFPGFWKVFSYIFPSTFAVQAFINMNTAGASLSMAAPQIAALTIQIIVYYFLSCLAVFAENRLLRHKGQGSLRPA